MRSVMNSRVVSLVCDTLLVAVMLLWVIGVDYMPFMRVLGLPLFIGAYALWVNYSQSWQKVSKWMDDGFRGEFNE